MRKITDKCYSDKKSNKFSKNIYLDKKIEHIFNNSYLDINTLKNRVNCNIKSILYFKLIFKMLANYLNKNLNLFFIKLELAIKAATIKHEINFEVFCSKRKAFET